MGYRSKANATRPPDHRKCELGEGVNPETKAFCDQLAKRDDLKTPTPSLGHERFPLNSLLILSRNALVRPPLAGPSFSIETDKQTLNALNLPEAFRRRLTIISFVQKYSRGNCPDWGKGAAPQMSTAQRAKALVFQLARLVNQHDRNTIADRKREIGRF